MRPLRHLALLLAGLLAAGAGHAACESGLAERMHAKLHPQRPLDERLAACKPWPAYPGRSIVVLPMPRETSDNGAKVYDLEVLRQYIEKFVKEGDSWAKARRGYQITLSTHTDAVNIMAKWLGGAFVNRDKKGDPGNRAPIAVVPAKQQRAALKFIIENSFYDQAFGLTPELLNRMTVDKWYDEGGRATFGQDATWPVHDRIMGVQASVLTMLMNPSARASDDETALARRPMTTNTG